MKRRCDLPSSTYYSHYGARGITYCTEWATWETFRDWAKEAGYRPGLTLERIDNDGNYEPGNCRWVTPSEQARNRRSNIWINAFGETKSLYEWGKDARCHVGSHTIKRRINAGWTAEEAISTPPSTGPYAKSGGKRA